jgi:hypothetical protein
MLALRMYAADVAALPDDLDSALAELGEDYRPVLDRGIEAQVEALGFPREALRRQGFGAPDTDAVVRFAELLATPAGVIGVYATEQRFGRGGVRLQLYAVGSQEIAQLLYGLASSLSDRYDIALSPHRYESERFEKLFQQGLRAASAPSAPELAAARLLSDPVVRGAARAIAISDGGVLSSDMSKQFDAGSEARAEEVKNSLESTGLLSKEIVVTCARSESQILRVPSRDALETMSEAGAKCACGRALLDERIEQAVMLTELGRGLLNGSRWMSVLVVSTLHALGIDYAAMVVEQQTASAETDCFVDISGELCLFELKDGEFDLGNAFSLGDKLELHGPAQAGVITTSSVESDAREHLRGPQPTDEDERVTDSTSAITYIEGIDDLLVDLGSLIESIYASQSVELLRQCLPFVTLDAASLVRALRAPDDALESARPTRVRVVDRR